MTKRTPVEKCEYCGGPIPDSRRRRGAKTCSLAHAKARQKACREHVGAPVEKPAVAEINRLRVVADLLKRGLRVMQPYGEAGFVVFVDKCQYKVKVSTGYRRPSGELQWPKPKNLDENTIYAVVIGMEEIKYICEDPFLSLEPKI